ncbi:hypothetical protein CCH79_00001173 [Gambusia affinis]|uniref:Tubulin-specific chaperone A n=1 Tax=Gambusia affinis TaxID=33528 RepID=A0A315VU82_GAMAF|nr:hypothetical protein CCH79_00001173 [Gambusia affinis]
MAQKYSAREGGRMCVSRAAFSIKPVVAGLFKTSHDPTPHSHCAPKSPSFLHLFLLRMPPSPLQADDITHRRVKTARAEGSRRRYIWCLFKSFLMEAHYDKGLAKEELSYIKEAKQQEEKVERLKAEGGDEFVIKKQVFTFYWFSGFNASHLLMEVLQESRMMVPDCRRRLTVAHADLLQLLETEADLAESEDYKEARKVLDSVKLEG